VDEAGELAITHALLRRASEGALDRATRVYSPVAPVVVFGRRDTRLRGFPAAVRAAEGAGFDVAVRAVGGRVVAYTQSSIVLDLVQHEPQAVDGLEERFVSFGNRMAEALGGLGVDTRVGAVPGEYCPGAHSVNARGVVKLVGTAQRVVKDAWLFSALVIVDDERRLQEVLAEVHGHLDLAFDASSVGSLRGENGSVTLEEARAAVERAFTPTDGL
jgi:octanoyl-[GcvH]:protein N-octanoyltransferase